MASSNGQLNSISGRLSFSDDGVRTVLLKSVPVTIGGRSVPRTGMRVLDATTGKELMAFNPPGERASDPTVAGPSTSPVRVPAPAVAVITSLAINGTGQRVALTALNVRVSMAASTPASGQSPSGMAFAGSDVVVWTAPHEHPTLSLSFSDRFATGAEFSSDGRYLALITAAYSDTQQARAEYRVYDAATGRLAAAFAGDRKTAPIAFSRDGRLIAAETPRHTVTIWNLDRPGRPIVLAEQRTPVTQIAFSPDATRIATLSDQGVTLFDVAGGQQLLGLREATGPFSTRDVLLPGKIGMPVSTLEFSVDGRQIILMTIASDPKGIKVTFKTWAGGRPN
jgi:WD40 repeat protein